jgi:hypothetical protein
MIGVDLECVQEGKKREIRGLKAAIQSMRVRDKKRLILAQLAHFDVDLIVGQHDLKILLSGFA